MSKLDKLLRPYGFDPSQWVPPATEQQKRRLLNQYQRGRDTEMEERIYHYRQSKTPVDFAVLETGGHSDEQYTLVARRMNDGHFETRYFFGEKEYVTDRAINKNLTVHDLPVDDWEWTPCKDSSGSGEDDCVLFEGVIYTYSPDISHQKRQ